MHNAQIAGSWLDRVVQSSVGSVIVPDITKGSEDTAHVRAGITLIARCDDQCVPESSEAAAALAQGRAHHPGSGHHAKLAPPNIQRSNRKQKE